MKRARMRGWRGALLGTALAATAAWATAPDPGGEEALQAGRDAATSRPAFVERAEVKGAITPATVDFLRAAIRDADRSGAAALVVVLDTPGGLLESTKSIVQDLLSSPVPVLVYVSPGGASATSAGVFVTMAAHIAAMAPGTSIGAAHPVGGQGQDIEGDMGKKVENFTTGFVTAIAQRRGRNVEWAEKAVRESVTATENEAVENRIVDFVAADIADLLRKSSGREVEVDGVTKTLDFAAVFDEAGKPRLADIEMTFRQRVVAFVSDPNIAYLLMMGAMLGLYVEISNPGLILPGVAGAICLLLALLAAQVLPISSTGALLILIGSGFIVAELFFPSFGALGVGGILALALGSLFLYTPESSLRVDRDLISGVVATASLIVAVIVLVLVRDRRRQPKSGSEGMVDMLAVALDDLDPSGKVKVRGEIWNAVSRTRIPTGATVRVVAVRGLELDVVAETTEETP